MSEIISYKNDSTGAFCQIKYEDGNRILISSAQVGIAVHRLKWLGLVPAESLLNISTEDLFSDNYKSALSKLTEISTAPNILDAFKDWLLPLKSIKEVKQELDSLF